MLLIVLVAITVLISSSVGIAYPSYKNINVPNITQQDSLLCWAASSVSSLQYNGWTTSQTDFVAAVKGSYSNSTASANQVINGLSHFGATSSYAGYGFQYSTIQYQMSTVLKPAIIGLHNGSYAHMVVLTGYDNSGSSSYVIIMDPAYGCQMYATYDSLYANWIETIYNIH